MSTSTCASPNGARVANLMLVGGGPHAKHFYIPVLKKLGSKFQFRLKAIVELEKQEQDLRSYCAHKDISPDLIFVEPFRTVMPDDVRGRLDRYVEENAINGVVIATDPLTHKVYALWALDNGLNILMDKPITTRRDAVSDLAQAEGIEEDYRDLLSHYSDLQEKTETCFVICTHRRYHPGISRVIELISEVRRLTGCPVTNIHSYHSDGQWRLPGEIVTQEHHTYNQGSGKASHSGYHFYDCVYRFLRAGAAPGKTPDEMTIFASFVQPDGFLEQVTEEDYYRLFGPDYKQAHRFRDSELRGRFKTFGELDVDAIVSFRKGSTPICNATLDLLHNGFSRRSWMMPGEDLYKGNGRVKHEQHRIHQGPFQCIQIHSYQAKDEHQRSGLDDLGLGGNNHFDIVIFRNASMLGGGQPLEEMRLTDIEAAQEFDKTRLFIEQVKEGAVLEFLKFLDGTLSKADLKSGIEDHLVPVQIMSGIYVSHIRGILGENPLVRKSISVSPVK